METPSKLCGVALGGASLLASDVCDVISGLRRWTESPHAEVTLYAFLESDGRVGATLSFRELLVSASALSHALRRWRVARGDLLLLLFPPTSASALRDFAVALFACFLHGAVAVPAYPPDPSRGAAAARAQLAQLGRVAAASGARLALTTPAYSLVLHALRLRFWSDWPAGLSWRSAGRFRGPVPTFPQPAPQPRAIAFLQFSSGSTGNPKGVCVTHGSLAHNCALIRSALQLDAGCTEVSWLPLVHDMGLIGGLLTAVTVPPPPAAQPPRATPCVVIFSPLAFLRDPTSWPRALSAHGATHTQAPSFAYALAASRCAPAEAAALDLRRLRSCLVGAEPASEEALGSFAAAFAPSGLRPGSLFQSYGLAEHTLLACSGGRRALELCAAALEEGGIAQPPAAGARSRRLLSCGLPPPGVRLLVVDAAGAPLPPRRVGELWLQSPSVAAGYYNGGGDDAFWGRAAGELGQWLRTGDLGFLDADGELFFVSRAKDLLKLRGRSLSPQDLEACAEAASPLLRRGCAAAFLLHPDSPQPSLQIMAELRCSAHSDDDDERLRAAVAAAVFEHHHVAARVHLLPPRSLPKTTSGKVRRSECRRLLLSQPSAALPPPPPPPFRLPRSGRAAALERCVAEAAAACGARLGARGWRDADLFACGLDSAAAAALHNELEARLGRQLPPALLFESRSAAAIARTLLASWPPEEGCDSAEDGGDEDAWLREPEAGGARGGRAAAVAAVALAAAAAVLLCAHARTLHRLGWLTGGQQGLGGPAYHPGWLPGRRIDVSHWRLLEWSRSVLPIHLTANAAAALLLRALPPRRRPAAAAAYGLAHAGALHGLWALHAFALAAACFAARRAAAARAVPPAAVARAAWAAALSVLLIANLNEPGNVLHEVQLWRAPLAAAERAAARAAGCAAGGCWEGLLGSTSFTANRALRYHVLRLLSYALEYGDAEEGKDGLAIFTAYAFYAPLYLAGPVMGFAQFAAAHRGGPSLAPRLGPALGRLLWPISALLAFELASQSLYYPAAVLRPALGASAPQLGIADYAVVSFLFLTATWLCSALVFALPRLLAELAGVPAPNDTPRFWAAAARSARSFWASFHTSLFAFFCKHVHAPLGGGGGATIAVVALSTFIHGFHAHWLAWGILNGVTLGCERRLARCVGGRSRGLAARAANHAAVVAAMLALAAGGGMPAGVMPRLAALGFGLALLYHATL